MDEIRSDSIEEESSSVDNNDLDSILSMEKKNFLQYNWSINDDITCGALLVAIVQQPGSFRCCGINEISSMRLLRTITTPASLKKMKLTFLLFRGIHSATFCAVSNNRIMITIDLYIKRFLPVFVRKLRETSKSKEITVTAFLHGMINPFLEGMHPVGNTGKAIVQFAALHRKHYSTERSSRLPSKYGPRTSTFNNEES